MVRYGIHPNRSKVAKYMNLASTKFTILIVRISRILCLANKRSYLTCFSKVQKLSSKEVEGDACCGAGGTRGDTQDGAQVACDPGMTHPILKDQT